jgi:thiamine biosynthesis protein ThiS
MNLILNNRSECIPEDILTIRQLLDYKKYTFKMLVVKINGKIIHKSEFDKATIKDGDDVMILHLISGG